jgi:hypothetical protein
MTDDEMSACVDQLRAAMVFKYGRETANTAAEVADDLSRAVTTAAAFAGVPRMALLLCVIEMLSIMTKKLGAIRKWEQDQREQN